MKHARLWRKRQYCFPLSMRWPKGLPTFWVGYFSIKCLTTSCLKTSLNACPFFN
jgi:hypothetical protein